MRRLQYDDQNAAIINSLNIDYWYCSESKMVVYFCNVCFIFYRFLIQPEHGTKRIYMARSVFRLIQTRVFQGLFTASDLTQLNSTGQLS